MRGLKEIFEYRPISESWRRCDIDEKKTRETIIRSRTTGRDGETGERVKYNEVECVEM